LVNSVTCLLCLPLAMFHLAYSVPLFLSFFSRSNGHKKKKKPQHATVPEGDDEDDDTDASSTTASALADDEKYVAKALGKVMGENDDDPDIAEVRRRLLGSSLLRSAGDIGLDQSVDGDIENGHNTDSEIQKRNWSGYSIGGSEKGSESSQRNAPKTQEKLASPDGGSSFLEALLPTIFIAEIEKQRESKGTSDEARVEKHDDQAESDSPSPPTPERLFAPSDGGSTFAESLRPSIFTTFASMAEAEEIEEDEGDIIGVASIAEDEENKEDEVERVGLASIADDEENKDDVADQADGETYDDQDTAEEECMGGQAGGKSNAKLL
jgi:hypothetical protein